MPDSNGLASKNKGIYKYVQNVHTGPIKRRELATDVSTQLSTYIKTSTNEEKFQYKRWVILDVKL